MWSGDPADSKTTDFGAIRYSNFLALRADSSSAQHSLWQTRRKLLQVISAERAQVACTVVADVAARPLAVDALGVNGAAEAPADSAHLV